MSDLILTLKGMNTDTNLVTMGADALILCRDIVFGKENTIQTRDGNIWDFTTTPGASRNYKAVAQDKYTDDIIYISKTSVNQFYRETPTALAITANMQSTPPVLVNTKPVMFNHKSNRYYMTHEGLMWDRGDSLGVNRVIFPVITSVTDSTVYPANANVNTGFIVPGNRFGIAITTCIDVGTTNEPRVIESDPFFYVVDQTSLKPLTAGTENCSLLTSTITVNIKNTSSLSTPLSDKITVKCYRTKQVPYTQALPVNYYLAAPESATLTTGSATSKDFLLNVNDDGIITLDQLYTNPNIDGPEAANHHVLSSKGVTQFKNYTFYHNLAYPGITDFTLTSNGAGTPTFTTDYTNYLGASPATVTLTGPTAAQTANATSVGRVVSSETDLSYAGFDTTNYTLYTIQGTTRGTAVLDAIYTTSNGMSLNSNLTATDTVYAYYQKTGTLVLPFSSAPSTFVKLDQNKFVAPGFAALCDADGTIKMLISYQSVSTTTDALWTGVVGGALAFYGTKIVKDFGADVNAVFYNIFYFPGTSITSVPVYISAVSNSDYQLGLKPTIGCLQEPVAIVGATSGNPYSTTGSGATRIYKAKVAWLGIRAKSPSQLIDLRTTNLVNSINGAITTDIIKAYKGPEVGYFYIIPRIHTGDTFKFYDSSGALTFVPAIPSSPTTTQIAAENRKNAFLVSRFNNPEVVPISQILAPYEVGDKNEAIQAMVGSGNDLLILKERSYWRTSVVEGTSVPFLDSITIVDPTVGCVSGGSATSVNGEVLWLSERGFMSSTDGLIGKDISKETTTVYQVCKNAGLTESIRCFGNEQKRLYGCYIPTSASAGEFYVFDCYQRKWAKWSQYPIDMTVKKTGELITLEQIYDNTSAALSQHPRTDSSAPYTTSNQYESKTIVGVNAAANATITSTTLYKAISSNKSSASTFIDRSGTLLPVVATRINTSSTLSFDIQVFSTDYFVVPVSTYVSFGPYTADSPGTMKQLSKYSVHTEGGVHNLYIRFKTDSRSDYTAYRLFSTYSVNRTIYQTMIPVEASRGRYFIRDIRHEYPYEFLKLTGQEFESRPYSTKTQKAPR